MNRLLISFVVIVIIASSCSQHQLIGMAKKSKEQIILMAKLHEYSKKEKKMRKYKEERLEEIRKGITTWIEVIEYAEYYK